MFKYLIVFCELDTFWTPTRHDLVRNVIFKTWNGVKNVMFEI